MMCAFTGHRPSRFHFGYDEQHQDCIRLKWAMASQITTLIHNGVTTFLTGMALGVDMWGATFCAGTEKNMVRASADCSAPMRNAGGSVVGGTVGEVF